MKQIVMTCDLDDNPEAIETYKKYHSEEHIWPVVEEAAENSGYQSIKIYLFGTRLVMVLEYPDHMDIDEINRLYRDTDPEKMDEWSQFMVSMLNAPAGADSTQSWIKMENIYFFEKGDER